MSGLMSRHDRDRAELKSMAEKLTLLQRACNDLSKCGSVSEVNERRNQADAFLHYVRNAKEGLELVNKVAEFKIRAERRAGELLMPMNLQGGDRMSKIREDRVTLEKLGISRYQACRCRKLAAIPDAVLEHAFRSANEGFE